MTPMMSPREGLLEARRGDGVGVGVDVGVVVGLLGVVLDVGPQLRYAVLVKADAAQPCCVMVVLL